MPPPVVLVELAGDAVPAALPWGAPAAPRAVPQRVAEFASGRWCAEQALYRLGVAAGPVGLGLQREPLWPAGVVGSITHSGSLRAAAVAHAADIVALGIDVEVDHEFPAEVVGTVLTAQERAWLARLPQLAAFSIKEAIFKAWFPRTGIWLDFLDVELEPLRRNVAPEATMAFRVHPTASAPTSPELDLRTLICLARVGAGHLAATAHLPAG